MSIRHQTSVSLTALGLLSTTLVLAASAQTAINGPDPFAGCTADHAGKQDGTVYPGATVEPWVDASPVLPGNMIAAWQQDRWSNGGARSLMSAYTTNAGRSWTPVIVPGITLCSGGAYERASDPWVSFGRYGDAYFVSLSFDNNRPNGANGVNAVIVNKSTDGGKSWGHPIEVIRDTDGKIFNDKEMIKADPTNASYIYAAWDRLVDYTLQSHAEPGAAGQSSSAITPMQVDSARAARDRLAAKRAAKAAGRALPAAIEYLGPTYFARSVNGGSSWQPAKMIFDTGPNAQTIGNQVVVTPDGTVMDFYTNITQEGAVRLGFVTSVNHGASFGPNVNALDMTEDDAGVSTPDTHEPVRDATILFDVAVDPGNGHLYLVWQDYRWGGISHVAFSMSTNHGFSWSIPVRIDHTPKSSVRGRNQAFIPSIAVGPKHKLEVTYYDFRKDTSAAGKELTDVWALSCDPTLVDCRSPSGWGHERRLTAASFNMQDAPVASGHFLGDYQGLVRRGGEMVAVFGATVAHNVNNMLFKPFAP